MFFFLEEELNGTTSSQGSELDYSGDPDTFSQTGRQHLCPRPPTATDVKVKICGDKSMLRRHPAGTERGSRGSALA